MKRLTTVALVGAMAVSTAATASVSRWNGFGASSQFIADVQDMWTLPAVVASNADATYFEFGSVTSTYVASDSSAGINSLSNGAWGGVNGKVGPGVLAIWGNRPYGNFSNISGAFLFVPSDNSAGNTPSTSFATPSQTIDLIYGWAVNEQFTIGLGVNRAVASTSSEQTVGGTTTVQSSDVNDMGINLGADIKGVGPISLLEIGLQYNMLNGTNRDDDGTENNKITEAGMDLNIRVGGDIAGENGAFQRVELGFGMENLEYKSEPETAAPAGSYVDSKNSDMSWLLGWAMGMGNEKGMGLGGFILSGKTTSLDEPNLFGNDVVTYDTSMINLSFVAAGEAKLKDWLTARAGLSSTLWGSNSSTLEFGATGSTEVDEDSSSQPAGTVLSTGLSFNIGDITIDGVLNQDLLYTGSYLVSGVPAALFGQVSATWAWGGAKE